MQKGSILTGFRTAQTALISMLEEANKPENIENDNWQMRYLETEQEFEYWRDKFVDSYRRHKIGSLQQEN